MIENLLKEERVLESSKAFRASAWVNDPAVYERARANPESFWERFAEELSWMAPWEKALVWKLPDAKWFVGGKLNASSNCVDRHALGPKRDKVAFYWEGEPGDTRKLTYTDLYRDVVRCASVLKKFGVQKGDRVGIYMPMVPELPVAMLACARIGAVHSVVFAGFSSESLRDRMNDAKAKLVITADGGYRRGKALPLKQIADEACLGIPSVETVLVVKRTGETVSWNPKRDHWWHEELEAAKENVPAEPMDAEDLLFILYTSGTTGKPKGIMHTTGGYLVGTYATAKWVFDLKDEDVYWCTADIGWITGHSYIVYGPLANGATCVLYEGAPDWPEKDRFWKIVEKYRVSVFYTAPTAIRTFMKWGGQWPARCDLSSLRLLGSVGEPINPEAWMWYYKTIGRERSPVVDTWWQTETGMILITPLPGVTALKPGSASRAFPGIEADVVNEQGQTVKVGGGYLVLTKPWPAMLRGIYGDQERYLEQYWSRFKGLYFTGDGARRDEDGNFWLLGRVDDVLNVAGHRIGTMEVESALVDHPFVAEAAVVGKQDDLKGQALAAFVTLKDGHAADAALADSLKAHVVKKIGSIARPDTILFSAELPKTRSGKIMRRLLRDIADGKALGDTTTLADPNVVRELAQRYAAEEP